MFVLMSKTRGDELIRSKEIPVATSEDRDELERLKAQRAEERKAWLDKNWASIPWWAGCGLVESEDIREVLSV